MYQFEIQLDRTLVDVSIATSPAPGTRRADRSSAAQAKTASDAPTIECADDANESVFAEARKMTQDSFGLAKSQQQLNKTMNLIAEQLANLRTERIALSDAVLNRSYHFVHKIAAVVFQHSSELATARLQEYVKSGLESLDSEADIRIFVHPSMLESTRKQIDGLPTPPLIEIEEDRQLLPGDCRLEQGDEGLYASLHSQLEKIETYVLNAAIEDRQ